MTLNGKNKILAESYFGKKKFLQIVLLKKKKKNSYSEEIALPSFPPPQKLNGPSLNQFRNKSSNTI